MITEFQKRINDIVSIAKISSEEGMLKYLKGNPGSVSELIKLSSADLWVSFVEDARDGWYCLNDFKSNPGWSVFFQERGEIQWRILNYLDVEPAVVALLINSGYCKFER